jgi:hypothetical protein
MPPMVLCRHLTFASAPHVRPCLAQATMYQLKLETARTASQVSLQNQAATLEAAASRALDAQLAK